MFYLCFVSVSFLLTSFPEAATNYTFLQSAEKMWRIRKGIFPATPQNIAVLHELLMTDENCNFAETLQNSSNRYHIDYYLLNKFII